MLCPSERDSPATALPSPGLLDRLSLIVELLVVDRRSESLTIFRELDVFLEYPVASRVPAPTREFLESLGRGRHVKNIRRLEVPRPGRLPHAVCRRHGWRSVIVGRLGQGASLIE